MFPDLQLNPLVFNMAAFSKIAWSSFSSNAIYTRTSFVVFGEGKGSEESLPATKQTNG